MKLLRNGISKLKSISQKGMIGVCEHAALNLTVYINRYDPTRTAGLRNLMTRESNRRVNDFIRELGKAVRNGTVSEYFEFLSGADKLEEFEVWLDRNMQSLASQWADKYIYDAYRRGVTRARNEMVRAGYKVPTIEDSGGIQVIMSSPFHMDNYRLVHSRVMSEINSIVEQTKQQLKRVFAHGLSVGDDLKTIAKKLVSVVNGKGVGELGITGTIGRFVPAKTRLETLARTEIIRSHHLAMTEEYESWGVQNVEVMAEWKTAGDARVCPLCASMEGKVFTIRAIREMIPAHPRCRCIALPVKIKKGGK